MDNLGFKYTGYKIIGKSELAPDTFLFRLEGRIDFIPGQFVQAAVDHFGEATFAVCSDPAEKKFFELCVRGCGNTTNALIKLLPGDKLKLRGPYGNGWRIAPLYDHDVVLVAGGVGYAPLRPLIYWLLANRKKIGKISLFAGFKTPEHIVFKEEIEQLQAKLSAVSVYCEFITKKFWGEKGMITEPLKKTDFNAEKTTVVMCGPEIMCPYCNDVFLKKNIAESQIFISFERRMECGIGVCQHCNIGKYLVCKDGPIFRLDQIKDEIGK